MDFAAWISPEAGLAGLFAASFLSATVLPGGSEALLFALVRLRPETLWPALALATLGNTLGGLCSYGLARLLPQRLRARIAARSLDRVRRHGSPVLLFSWLPVVGDALCLAAGWLRLSFWPCVAWIALGKGVRYAAVLAGTGAF